MSGELLAHHVEIFMFSESRVSILDDLWEQLAEGNVADEDYASSIAGKINTNLVLPTALALEIRVCTIDRNSVEKVGSKDTMLRTATSAYGGSSSKKYPETC
jgi:hypothetical protein